MADPITAANAVAFYKTLFSDNASVQAYLNSVGNTVTGPLSDIAVGSSIPPAAPGGTFFPLSEFDAYFNYNFPLNSASDATYIDNTCMFAGAINWATPNTPLADQITALEPIFGTDFAGVCAIFDGINRAPGDTTPGYCFALNPQGIASQSTCDPPSGDVIQVFTTTALVYLSAGGTPPPVERNRLFAIPNGGQNTPAFVGPESPGLSISNPKMGGAIGCEGLRTIPIQISFSNDSVLQVDLTFAYINKQFTTMQTIYAYNNSTKPLLIGSNSGAPAIIFPPGFQGYMPIVVGSPPVFSVECDDNTANINMQFLNMQIPPAIWPV